MAGWAYTGDESIDYDETAEALRAPCGCILFQSRDGRDHPWHALALRLGDALDPGATFHPCVCPKEA